MKTVADRLREGDPLRRDPGLSDDESAALRRRVVQEAYGRQPRRLGWREPLTLVGALALLIMAAMVTDRRQPVRQTDALVPTAPIEVPQPRQLQFSTPGGTRIIWTLDPEFTLKGPVR
jgi:hypothetical protein